MATRCSSPKSKPTTACRPGSRNALRACVRSIPPFPKQSFPAAVMVPSAENPLKPRYASLLPHQHVYGANTTLSTRSFEFTPLRARRRYTSTKDSLNTSSDSSRKSPSTSSSSSLTTLPKVPTFISGRLTSLAPSLFGWVPRFHPPSASRIADVLLPSGQPRYRTLGYP